MKIFLLFYKTQTGFGKVRRHFREKERESLVPSNSIDCFKKLSSAVSMAINKETGRTMGVIVRGFSWRKDTRRGIKNH